MHVDSALLVRFSSYRLLSRQARPSDSPVISVILYTIYFLAFYIFRKKCREMEQNDDRCVNWTIGKFTLLSNNEKEHNL